MTPSEQDTDSLPERAEALLDGWPAPGRGALEWENAAARTMERVRETTIGSTPGALLDAPLAGEDGEGSLSSPPMASEEPLAAQAPGALEPAGLPDEPPMLANIARAVLAAGAGTSPKDVARAVLLAAEEERRSAPPAPPSRHRYGTAAHRGDSRGHPLQGSPVQAMHEASARSDLPAREQHPERRSFGVIAFGAGAALALAAGAALYVSVRTGGPAVLANASAEAPQATIAATSTATPAAAPRPNPSPNSIALDVLPTASSNAQAAAAPRAALATAAAPLAAAPVAAPKDSLAFSMKNAPAGKIVLEERNEEGETAPQAQAVAPAAAPPPSSRRGGENRPPKSPGFRHSRASAPSRRPSGP